MNHPHRYGYQLKPYARQLRREGTRGEGSLWYHALKARKMNGYQFNRQFPIGHFIVDFICRKLNLIIEVDGSSHITRAERDLERQNFLEAQGYVVLRFTEAEVVHRLDDVVADISYAVEALEKGILNPPCQ